MHGMSAHLLSLFSFQLPGFFNGAERAPEVWVSCQSKVVTLTQAYTQSFKHIMIFLFVGMTQMDYPKGEFHRYVFGKHSLPLKKSMESHIFFFLMFNVVHIKHTEITDNEGSYIFLNVSCCSCQFKVILKGIENMWLTCIYSIL